MSKSGTFSYTMLYVLSLSFSSRTPVESGLGGVLQLVIFANKRGLIYIYFCHYICLDIRSIIIPVINFQFCIVGVYLTPLNPLVVRSSVCSVKLPLRPNSSFGALRRSLKEAPVRGENF